MEPAWNENPSVHSASTERAISSAVAIRLIGGLLDRLVHLSKGLTFILAFIGVKLILEAMHHHGVAWAPEIPILICLGVIVGTLTVTTIASLVTSRRDAATAAPGDDLTGPRSSN